MIWQERSKNRKISTKWRGRVTTISLFATTSLPQLYTDDISITLMILLLNYHGIQFDFAVQWPLFLQHFLGFIAHFDFDWRHHWNTEIQNKYSFQFSFRKSKLTFQDTFDCNARMEQFIGKSSNILISDVRDIAVIDQFELHPSSDTFASAFGTEIFTAQLHQAQFTRTET